MTISNKLQVFFFALLLASGCGGNGNDPSTEDNNKDRKEILTNWADNIVIPSYHIFETKLDKMIAEAGEFKASPDMNSLSELRAAWVEAYVEWQNVELFEFGPADRYTLRNFFNIYPADVAGIQSNIADPASNLEVPAAYARQGFPALDYLINGVGESDETIVAYYEGEEGSERLAYLERLVTRMGTLLSAVTDEWTGSYKETFINNTGLDIGSSTGNVVNAYVLHVERFIRTGKIGIPSGALVSANGVPHPEKVEAFYKHDISKRLAENAIAAAKRFFIGIDAETGAEGPSFKSYLDALEAKDDVTGTLLSQIILDQFLAIEQQVGVLHPSFYQQVLTDNEAMLETHRQLQALVAILKVDMTSAMSVTITYADNDGD